MLQSTKKFLLLLGSLIAGGLVFGWLTENKAAVQPQFERLGRNLLLQPTSQRSWKSIPRVAVWRIRSEGGTPFFHGPINFKVDVNGRVFVVDYGDLSIKSFSPDGQFLRTFGNGRGERLEEFGSITDLSVDPDGRVFVVDQKNGRITIFNSSGGFIKALRLRMPYRVITDPISGEMIVMLPPDSSYLFGLFNSGGKLLRSFGRFLEKQEENGIALDGWIEPTDGGGFVYAPLYTGFIASYTGKGELRFWRGTLRPNSLPKVVKGTQAMWISGDAEISAQSLSVDGRKIYLLSSITNGLKKIGTVDAYDIMDGRYLYSRRLPERCTQALVRGDYFFTATENSVTKWRLES
jgi:hypothetical protein